jgi:5-methylcytosine-specific restriction endonuclease McrA
VSAPDAKPYSKETQLARGPKVRGRQKANKKRWEQIRAAKDGPCRICGGAPPNELHHLVPRAMGGDDRNANLVPLCHDCHRKVTNYDRQACATLRANLITTASRKPEDGDEYAYAVDMLGESRFEARYPVRYET